MTLICKQNQYKLWLPDLKGRYDRPLVKRIHRQQGQPFGLAGGLWQTFPEAAEKAKKVRRASV